MSIKKLHWRVLARFLGVEPALAPMEVVCYHGGQRESETLTKRQRLTCHTGQRTFATLALGRGVRLL